MANFKVIALSVGGKGNNIYKVGDIVKTENFVNAKALVAGGFLEEISEPKKEVEKTSKKNNNKKNK
tara:strand:+ start:3965 stop:4162 length:198 start_codon:yes stop_codon:yes gene_type:complete